MGDVVQLRPYSGNGAREVLNNHFCKDVHEYRQSLVDGNDLSLTDHLLASIWHAGYKVVPIND